MQTSEKISKQIILAICKIQLANLKSWCSVSNALLSLVDKKIFTYLINKELFSCGLPKDWSRLPQDNLMTCRPMKFSGLEWIWIRRKRSLLQRTLFCFESFPTNAKLFNEAFSAASINFFQSPSSLTLRIVRVSFWKRFEQLKVVCLYRNGRLRYQLILGGENPWRLCS